MRYSKIVINIFTHPITMLLECLKMQNCEEEKEKEDQIWNHPIPTNIHEGNSL